MSGGKGSSCLHCTKVGVACHFIWEQQQQQPALVKVEKRKNEFGDRPASPKFIRLDDVDFKRVEAIGSNFRQMVTELAEVKRKALNNQVETLRALDKIQTDLCSIRSELKRD